MFSQTDRWIVFVVLLGLVSSLSTAASQDQSRTPSPESDRREDPKTRSSDASISRQGSSSLDFPDLKGKFNYFPPSMFVDYMSSAKEKVYNTLHGKIDENGNFIPANELKSKIEAESLSPPPPPLPRPSHQHPHPNHGGNTRTLSPAANPVLPDNYNNRRQPSGSGTESGARGGLHIGESLDSPSAVVRHRDGNQRIYEPYHGGYAGYAGYGGYDGHGYGGYGGHHGGYHGGSLFHSLVILFLLIIEQKVYTSFFQVGIPHHQLEHSYGGYGYSPFMNYYNPHPMPFSPLFASLYSPFNFLYNNHMHRAHHKPQDKPGHGSLGGGVYPPNGPHPLTPPPPPLPSPYAPVHGYHSRNMNRFIHPSEEASESQQNLVNQVKPRRN